MRKGASSVCWSQPAVDKGVALCLSAQKTEENRKLPSTPALFPTALRPKKDAAREAELF